MRFLTAALLLGLGTARAADPARPIDPLSPGSASESARSAYEAFLQGRYTDAEAGYRALAALGSAGAEPDADLAVVLRDKGAADAALPAWVKASLQNEDDSFLWNQRGWAYLALDRGREARDSFAKALERSTTTANQAEANLGLGMTSLRDSRPKTALPPLREALVQGPYLIPQAAYQTGLTALGVGDKQAALAYFRQSVSQDPWQMESLKELGKLYEKIGENRMAWRAFQAALSSIRPIRKASPRCARSPNS